jgi:hypothetical protein
VIKSDIKAKLPIYTMYLKTLLFLFFIGFCSNRILMGESEAEFRANARILQERIDAENARIEKEAERIYHERKYGAHSSSAETVKQRSGNEWKSKDSWEDLVEQFKYAILIFSGGAGLILIIIICRLSVEKICAEDTGGLNRQTWDSLTKYKKIFFQNKNRITGKLDLKEYYSLVVEYNLCSNDKRRLEIGAVFAERKWGEPFLKQFEREPFKNEKAESNRKLIEQKRLLFLPCPECLTDIDCNDAQEGVGYSCNRCDCNYRFRKGVGLIAS